MVCWWGLVGCNMIAAGIFFYSHTTNRFLYLLRSDSGTWSIPGGKIETGECLSGGLRRECLEEIGYYPDEVKLIPIQRFENRNFVYHTFYASVENEFVPVLNDEHSGYAWVNRGYSPKPLHPGLFNTINFPVVQNKLDFLSGKIAA